MPTIILHILNEDPIVGDLDELPAPSDNFILVKNPRLRDGKDIPYLEHNVTSVVWPLTRINFIEILPGEDEDNLITFVRE